jgi:hypothetical protein
LGLQAAASFAHRKPAVLSGMSGASHRLAVTSGRGSATRRSEAESDRRRHSIERRRGKAVKKP